MTLPWPLAHRADLRERLVTAYTTDRGYHDLRHLTEVLARLDELGASGDAEVVLAAWFHDAVYDGAPDAEERSARLAEQELAGEAVDVAEVARLVRLTSSHRPEPDDIRGAQLCDADLAILAADAERYRAYTDDVRREYAQYDDATFAAGRLRVLEALAAKPTLFHTPHARQHWEARARANLAREISALRTACAAADPPR